ncbi:MAG: type III pantothenate kinase [Bacteroidota bacterium]
MNIAIDVGNTFVKLGVFEGNTLRESFEGLSPELALAKSLAIRPAHAIVSSVGAPVQVWQEALQAIATQVYTLNHTTPLPLINHYETPETLGTDRIAAAVGAQTLYPEENCLVIDMGTCITYDFVDRDHHYWGGSISPGLRMRLMAMHTFTSRLPLLELNEATTDLIGRNTTQAMRSGAIYGMAAELDGIIESYLQRVGTLRVIACGGDAPYFERRIKASIFVVSELVIFGLNRILQYNLSL